MAIGGALGLLFGLMLLGDAVAGLLGGAVLGAVIGTAYELLGGPAR